MTAPDQNPISVWTEPFRLEGVPQGGSSAVSFRRNPLARRYRLYVDRDGIPRMTIPRRGTLKEARELIRTHAHWLAMQVQRGMERAALRKTWKIGREIYFRGEPVRLELDLSVAPPCIRLGSLAIPLPSLPENCPANLRPHVEPCLRQLGVKELPPRVHSLALQHGTIPRKVVVRDQRTRWGSCSARQTLSLNWRLVQVPPATRDYIILHELMHLRELNHSPRFWRLVRQSCPDHATHEAWLRKHERMIL